MSHLGDRLQAIWDEAFPALSAVAVAVGACFLLSPLLSRSTWRRACRSLAEFGRTAWGGQSGDKDMSETAELMVLQQTLDNFRHVCRIFGGLMLASQVVMLQHALMGVPRVASRPQEALQVLSLLLFLLPISVPRALNARSINLFYCLQMLLCSAFVLPQVAQSATLMPALLRCNAITLLLSLTRRTLCNRGTRLLIFCSLVYGLCTCGALASMSCVKMVCTGMVGSQALFVLLGTVFAFQLDRGIVTMMSHGVELKETKEMYMAACALLRSCCEIVVELDEVGTILSPASDLGSFLLRGVGMDLKGRRLADLITEEEDKRLFEERLGEQRLQELGIAENLPVRTRDGNNNSLSLELLWFQFHRTDAANVSHTHYMLGIREFHNNVVQRVAGCNKPDCHHISTENSWSLPETSSTPMPMEPAIAFVDATKPGLPVQALSTGFTAQVGSLPIGSELKALLKDDGFAPWMQESLNRIFNNMRVREKRVVLQMPHGQVHAQCKVLETQDTEDLGLDHLPLCFTNVWLETAAPRAAAESREVIREEEVATSSWRLPSSRSTRSSRSSEAAEPQALFAQDWQAERKVRL